ncbi:PD-(D/E)XK nuclease family protein [Corynebacterium sp. ES2794-CONJ1]|uniref:RecB family exonuclease n=1 Tax=unclassified Corynebacterium TaxID=2624378 RepID=UPI0021682E51|nr:MULTISPECIES: PD-(D/E)XK nuclease family protein [unclassified Corynebacterium]MCS4489337.1 PD-(D/E)XK nuclease family protein [Corynebacterium sp. ES2775-CONJ]MCS4491150.1 PD-(D/E)XK nuclease family protein [Corynebacterium sp. ES2715-CONJ3]MCS4530969.1 PD-(D/E)XK nuclease family protein [Corynebacterium sp. ES2730-CONJ]MCU9518336.1 PD-(D/E)XK nuclease family protein [Corynebacterium sp. ES2794-CONJ1]
MKLALSPSRLSDFKQCPLLYRYRAIDKIPEKKTRAQIKGTVVHQCLEDLFSLDHSARTLDSLTRRIPEVFEHMAAKDPEIRNLVSTPEEKREFFNEAWVLLRRYFVVENPRGFDPLSCEKYINGTLPNGVPIRGFIDRVDRAPTGELRIVDYKTGKKPPERFSQQAMDQMRFYALAWWRLNNRVPTMLRLIYLSTDDPFLDLIPDREDLERFEHSLDIVWEKIQMRIAAQDFEATPSQLCPWCSYHALCPQQQGHKLPFPTMK